jgi:hypothetical protein
MDSPIFIIGLPRSGSTLWHNVIAKNQNILRLAEMHFLNPWRRDFTYFLKHSTGGLSTDQQIKNMIDGIFSKNSIDGITGPFWRFENIKAATHPKIKDILIDKILNSDRSLKSIFKIIIEEITYLSGFNRCCLKFPVYPNHLIHLVECYPQCKIIHIIRDPRAMAISRTNDPGGTAKIIAKYPKIAPIIKKIMMLFVVLQYIWTSKLHLKFKFLQNYRLYNYEDLLTIPEATIKDLCRFAEIDFLPAMLDPEKGQASSVTGIKQKGFNKKSATHWQHVISPVENKIITFLTKKSMKRFDYEPNTHPIYRG